MPFSAILLVFFFKFLVFSCLQVCKFTDLQVHNSIDCPYFYGLSVKISDLLHLSMHKLYEPAVFVDNYKYCKSGRRITGICQMPLTHIYAFVLFWVQKLHWLSAKQYIINRV